MPPTNRRLLTLLLGVLLLGAPLAPTTSAADNNPMLDIRGFGGWALGYTNNDNLYPDIPAPLASKDLALDSYYFTLNLLAHPGEKVLIHAQPTWQSGMRGRELTLDLLYAELTLAKGLLLRAGKIKNPLGLYTEVYKVGTLRPFYLLPNSYYRMVPEGYTGGGLNRVQPLGAWELEIDVLAGQMDFPSADNDMIIGFDPVAQAPVFGSIPVAAQGRDVFGGGLLLRSPIKGLEFGGSAYSMELWGSVAGAAAAKLAEERQKAYTASIEYQGEKVTLRSELLLTRGFEADDCAYVEGSYKLDEHWQVAAVYEYANFKKPEPLVPALAKHGAVGAGLNYWVSPKVVFKANYYHVTNNRVARPADAINQAMAGKVPKNTDVVIAGFHFSF